MKSLFFKIFLGFLLIMLVTGVVSVAISTAIHHLAFKSQRDDMVERLDREVAKVIILSGQSALQMFRHGDRNEYERYLQGLSEGGGTRIELITEENKTITGGSVSPEFIEIASEARNRKDTVFHKEKGGKLLAARLLRDGQGPPVVVVGVRSFGPPPWSPNHQMGPPPPPKPDDKMVGPGPSPGPMSWDPPPPPPDGDWGPPGAHTIWDRPPPGADNGGPELASVIRRFLPFLSHGRGDVTWVVIMLVVAFGMCYLLARSLTKPIRQLQRATREIAGGNYAARVGATLGKGGGEIADLGRDFDNMAEQTEKVMTAQKRLLRDISHELRSPLARMGVALELARRGVNRQEALAKIEKEGNRLNELIDQLLTLVRLETGACENYNEIVVLDRLLAEIASDVAFELANSSKKVEIIASRPLNITGCHELLRRAFENVIRNAALYTAENTTVTISLIKSTDDIVIEVCDHGPGVPEKDLTSLFLPFFRVSESRDRQSGGVGIGLAIAHKAIEAHGGSIVAVNRSNESGLIVRISLPLSLSVGNTENISSQE